MSGNTTISNAAAIAMCNALVDLLDAGSGPGKIRIYSGSQPAGPDAAVTDQILLAELALSDPAFGGAADANPGAVATAGAIADDTAANATGTATWFRALDSDDNAVIDGSVGVADADMTLNTTSIAENAIVQITAWIVTMPES